MSERGVGAGITAQTHGRSFVISTVSFATGGLPVGADSSPVSIALGRYLTPATTVTTGLSIARETPLSTQTLRNAAQLSADGAIIMPIMPPYYMNPLSTEAVLKGFSQRALQVLGQAQGDLWKAEDLEP